MHLEKGVKIANLSPVKIPNTTPLKNNEKYMLYVLKIIAYINIYIFINKVNYFFMFHFHNINIK